MKRLVQAACSLALLTLAGCGGAIAPSDLASLDGNWEGDIARARADQSFCREWGLRVAIRNGAVSGEIFDPSGRNVAAPFDGFLETDGRLFVNARVAGQVLAIQGAFGRNSFSGESTNPLGCRGFVSLSRARSR